MHTTAILVCKDVNYGASKISTTRDAAVNQPANLKDGSLGIITMSNAGLSKLLTISSATETDTLLDSDSANIYKNGYLDFFLGETPGFQKGAMIQLKGIKEIKVKAYTAPVKGIAVIGYAGSSYPLSSLNLGTTTLNEEARIKALGDREETTVKDVIFYNAIMAASESIYGALRKMADYINAYTEPAKHNADIILKGTETVLANASSGEKFTGSSGTLKVAVTNGSAIMVFSATNLTATAVVAGDIHIIYGRAYKVVTVGTPASNAVSITYDAVFEGATATATDVDSTNGTQIASITDGGVEIQTDNYFEGWKFAVGGAFEEADITYTVTPKKGSGYYSLVEAIEKDLRYYRNFAGANDPHLTQKATKADSAVTYSIYSIRYANDVDGDQVKTDNLKELLIAVPTGSQQLTDISSIFTSLATNMGTFAIVSVS